MFVTNWISTTKIQKISEITNFFILSGVKKHFSISAGLIYTLPSITLRKEAVIKSPKSNIYMYICLERLFDFELVLLVIVVIFLIINICE